ncbi:hypothetical protein P7D22_20000, partial [Lichenihabitans sp. Uapishka_5]|uniref:hypothetical protein n=1 Tax=Lichenihabitans sp. Uapishka_5 TaxID=3037302 RepID=UPI0029E82366
MRIKHAVLAAGLALGLMSETAQAAYILDIYQMDANVVARGSGSIDTSQLTLDGSGGAGTII